jgi:WD40 repeat protein/energy-coupling factor transporter ATP-binding protein EcfA2
LERITNPFVGLRSFEDSESHLFFGRDKQIHNVITNLENTGFTAIIGSSGSGKSSLIRSGLIHAIKNTSKKEQEKIWRIGIFKPGYDPINNLSECLCSEEIIEDTITSQLDDFKEHTLNTLRRNQSGISDFLNEFRKNSSDNILLIIDQFEEIFRIVDNEKLYPTGNRDSSAFVNLILHTLRDNRVHIALSMRSDFLGDCTQFFGLPEALNKGQYLIPRMTRNEVKEVIIRPITLINASISEKLVELLLDQIGNKPGQLPILQHTLMRVVDFWNNESNREGPIDIEHYNAVGGLEKALSNHADEAYSELVDPEDKLIGELIFKSLTDVSTNSKGIRRPCKLSTLAEQLNVSEKKIIEIIDVFRSSERSFLTPKISKHLDGEDLIDISHESLMREWDRLKFWSNEEAESSKTFLNLCSLAALYQEGKGSLLTNPELEVSLLWKERVQPTEKWAMRYDTSFVRAMTFLTQSKENHEFLILQKEIAQKNKIRRTKIFSIVISFAFILALGLALASYVWYTDAVSNKMLAETSAKKAIESEKTATQERDKALIQEQKANASAEIARKAELVAQQSDSTARLARDIAVREKIKAKESAIAEKRAADEAKKAQQKAVRAEGVANIQRENAIKSEKESKRLKNIAESIKGAFLALKNLDAKNYKKGTEQALKSYEKFSLNSREKRNSDIYSALNRAFVEGKKASYYEHIYGVKKVALSPILNSIAIIDTRGDLSLKIDGIWSSFQPSKELQLQGKFTSLSYSQDEKHLLLGTKTGALHILKTKPSITIRETLNFENEIVSLYASIINGINYFMVVEGNNMHLIKINKEEVRIESSVKIPNQKSNINYITSDFSNIIISNGTNTRIYSVALTAEKIAISEVNRIKSSSKISTIEMSSDRKFLALGFHDGLVNLVELDKQMNANYSKIINVHRSKVSDIKFIINKEESLLITSSYDNTMKIINIRNTTDIVSLKGHKGWIHQIELSADNRRITAVSEDKTVRNWFIYNEDIVKLLNKN